MKRLGARLRGLLARDIPSERPDQVDEMRPMLLDLRSRGLEARAILDVGAFDGRWSETAAEAFPSARFFLIEPQEEMKPSLDAFCQRHPGSLWLPAAAGAAAGERTLTTVAGDDRGASLLLEPSPQVEHGIRRRQVPIVTIDSLLEERAMAMPDLVKLDVQGFELQALRGGERLFGPVEAFILEVSLFQFMPGLPLFHEVVAFMAEREYYAYDFGGWLRRPYDRALGQTDVCFARTSGLLRATDRWR